MRCSCYALFKVGAPNDQPLQNEPFYKQNSETPSLNLSRTKNNTMLFSLKFITPNRTGFCHRSSASATSARVASDAVPCSLRCRSCTPSAHLDPLKINTKKFHEPHALAAHVFIELQRAYFARFCSVELARAAGSVTNFACLNVRVRIKKSMLTAV